jgi:hypothetical protein
MEAAMKEALLFVPHFSEDSLAGAEIQLIALKQISFSVVIALAVLSIAALTVI